jgi:hypothetical protein
MISEISAASTEQQHGIEQINIAVTELDSMTQQNASLVRRPPPPAKRCPTRPRSFSA